MLKFICGAYVAPCDHSLTLVSVSRAFLNDRIDFESTGDHFPFRCIQKGPEGVSIRTFSNHTFLFKISFLIESSGPCMGMISGLFP